MIVAKVNDYEIEFQEYKAELAEVLKNMHLGEPNNEARKRAIEQLIDGYLLLNSAKRSKINISEDDIEHEMVELKLKYRSENDFNNMLKNKEIDITIIKERIKNNLLITKYVKTNFSVETDIPIEKLQEIYKENLNSFKTHEMVKASHILVKGTDKDSLLRAQELYKKIKTKDDFDRIAAECSDCPSNCQCGDLGYFTKGKMVKNFEEVAFNLKHNEFSEPVKTEFGYHIIMNTGRKESVIADFEEVKDALKDRLKRIDSELKLIKHLKGLRSKADIVINHKKL
ncbi:MAG: peptidylprolyl isomerase [Candidatus Cloacimonetes bacterium]|nr:peptidylprolyl isomerase [Candidatus Cloacimonadota bacterium]